MTSLQVRFTNPLNDDCLSFLSVVHGVAAYLAQRLLFYGGFNNERGPMKKILVILAAALALPVYAGDIDGGAVVGGAIGGGAGAAVGSAIGGKEGAIVGGAIGGAAGAAIGSSATEEKKVVKEKEVIYVHEHHHPPGLARGHYKNKHKHD
jgi:hypothetical protein